MKDPEANRPDPDQPDVVDMAKERSDSERPAAKSSTLDLQKVGGAVLALMCAGVAVTCAATGELAPIAPATSAKPQPAASVSRSSSGPPATAPSVAFTPSPPSAAAERGMVLPRFCSAVRKLEKKQRSTHAHILWFGDSHTFADFLTHAVRKPLQARYGNGGPGFLFVGLDRYRHGGIKVLFEGQWRYDPPQPSRSSRWADGVFGLGGIRVVPDKPGAKGGAQLLRGAVSGKAKWQLWYRLLDANASIKVQIDEDEPRLLTGRTAAGPQIQHAKFEGGEGGQLVVRNMTGEPQILGAVVESSAAGVVLDTLGINGARAATPLAWDDASWQPLVAARQPDLVVLAYGTNEIFANTDPQRYHAHYEQLLTRLRSASREFDCLLVGPTDAATSTGASHERVKPIDDVQRAAAARLGCGFFSIYDTMGGEGGFTEWANREPALGADDNVHLTRAGYEEVGKRIADAILGACR